MYPLEARKQQSWDTLTRAVTYGIGGDRIDTQEGFQQAIFQGLVEARLIWNQDLRFFVSGKLNVDWAYQFNRNDSDWNDKQFDKSKNDSMFSATAAIFYTKPIFPGHRAISLSVSASRS